MSSLSPEQFRQQVWPTSHGEDWNDVETAVGGVLEDSVQSSGVRDPVRVARSRTGERPYVLVDGHHRAAAALRSQTEIPYREVEL